VYYGEEKIASLSELDLNGEHLVEDFLASLCVLKLLGITTEEIIKGAKTFKGVRHRLESVHNLNGIEFINDSKSTNPNSSINAVRSMRKNAVLIIGGFEKGLDYTLLMREIKKSKFIKGVVITGASYNRMFDSAVKEDVENVSVISNFEMAIKVAYMLCKRGETVLFSPATSSFDMFLDFEQRGDKFVEVALSL
jgi:UDP-N-acetylmuramoylalanine--D-glutamate ligase